MAKGDMHGEGGGVCGGGGLHGGEGASVQERLPLKRAVHILLECIFGLSNNSEWTQNRDITISKSFSLNFKYQNSIGWYKYV